MNKLSFSFLVLLAAALPASAQKADTAPESPIFEMDEVTVFHSPTDFNPTFSKEVPQLSYYDVPDLPRGDLILALEFFDRYRDEAIPGKTKWCGLLHFPIVDGYDRSYLKWLCLYVYNDRMFGYDPSALKEYERRFALPIPVEDRARPEVLFKFAESYVESIFPGGQDEFYTEEYIELGDGEMGYTEGEYEYIFVDPGRIAPVLTSERGKKPEELVRLIMQYGEEPNPQSTAEARMGRAKDVAKTPFTWDAFWEELGGGPDPLEIAAELVKPRWCQVTRFHYVKDRFILGEKEMSIRVLLFNIGQRIYAYSPKYGVWKTKATLNDIDNIDRLANLMQYPGIQSIARVEFVAQAVP